MEVLRIPVAEGVALNIHHWPGAAKAFVLVHGLASNARLWDGVAVELAAAGHEVVAIDQRGHGRSDKPDTGYDDATVAADVVAVISALGLEQPVAVGQSWGGNVVLDLGARRPSVASGVVCIDGGWSDFSRFETWEDCVAAMAPPRTTGMAFAQIEAGYRRRHPDWPEAGVQGALACFEARDDGTVAPWLSYDRHLMILRSMYERHPAEVLANVGCPVLLVPCEGGRPGFAERKRHAVDACASALAAAGAPARVHWFTAEHDVHAQYPAEVASLLMGCTKDGFFT